MRNFNWTSLFGAMIAAAMFGFAYGQAVPEGYHWWVPVLFGMGLAVMRNRT